MKPIQITSAAASNKRGSAVIATILMALLASAITAAYLNYSINDTHQARRALDYQQAKILAESGLDYATTEIRKSLNSFRFALNQEEMQALLNNIPAPPSLTENMHNPIVPYQFRTPSGQTAFKITVDSQVERGIIPAGTLRENDGKYQQFSISCGAINPQTGVGAVVRQQMLVASAFVLRFGVFYEDDLEILPGPTMVFTGAVHSNSDMYLGGPLTFESRITSAGDIFHRRKNDNSLHGNARVNNNAGQAIPMVQSGTRVDSSHPDWTILAIDNWDGRVRSIAHGISELAPPIADGDLPHSIIERPLAEDHPNYQYQTEREKFANKAALTLHVAANGSYTVRDSLGVNRTSLFTTATLQSDGTTSYGTLHKKDSNGLYRITGSGSVRVHPAYTVRDAREGKYLAMVDIYLDKFMAAYPALYSGTTYSQLDGRGILYVTIDQRSGSSFNNHIPAVRIRNGRDISGATAGLTIASDRPVYIEGFYNTVNTIPALVAGDAVTMLSRNWQDARSHTGSKSDRVAANTAYHTVLMTGNSATVPYVQYNGGLENVLRFLESWGNSRTVTFRGSIVDLWYSEHTSGAWNGTYYDPPVRDWGYDARYLYDAPPGVPEVFSYDEVFWEETNWGTVGWN